VKGAWNGKPVRGFAIRPISDVDHPPATPAGGHVVTDDVPDTYRGDLRDL
jgi:hypothetical protein